MKEEEEGGRKGKGEEEEGRGRERGGGKRKGECYRYMVGKSAAIRARGERKHELL